MLKSLYRERVVHWQAVLKKLLRKDVYIGLLRLLLIAAVLFSFYFYFREDELLWLFLALLFTGTFGYTLKQHWKNRTSIAHTRALIEINEQEIAYHTMNFSGLENGGEFIDPSHLFATDLDIFGNHSLFQRLNRTITLGGRECLAAQLGSNSAGNIAGKQKAVQELSSMLDWRQEFLASGKSVREDRELVQRVEHWLKSKAPDTWLSPWLLYPLAALACALLVNFFIFPTLSNFNWLGYAFGFNLLVVFLQFKRIKKEYRQLEGVTASLDMYSKLLQSIEEEKFASEELERLKNNLVVKGTTSSRAVKKLSRLLDGFDQTNNVIALLLTNGLYHYHLHVLRGLYKWKKQYGSHVRNWLEAVAGFDQYVSLANFAFNHPEYNYPEISNDVTFFAEQMGHPLLNPQKRVSNNLGLGDYRYIILTGSNMSGKSTFLKTVGVNLVLARAGAPVCAEKFRTYPFILLSSMKTADSLEKEESYFQAEVLRLKRIQLQLEKNEPCFVLLDEILRGTNSDDKRHGTRLFMQKIAGYRALGIIATHDIDIADLAQEKEGIFKAMFFESRIEGENLWFDYKLRKGVCTTPNATRLMQAQGII